MATVRGCAEARVHAPRPDGPFCIAWMNPLHSLGQLEHIVMGAADNPVAAHLGEVRRRQAHGDGIIIHVQADEERASRGRFIG